MYKIVYIYIYIHIMLYIYTSYKLENTSIIFYHSDFLKSLPSSVLFENPHQISRLGPSCPATSATKKTSRSRSPSARTDVARVVFFVRRKGQVSNHHIIII